MSSTTPAALKLMRPSCGRRFSEMFMRAMIFRREMMASWKRSKFSGSGTGTSKPSTRYRMRSAPSCGSKWMSVA